MKIILYILTMGIMVSCASEDDKQHIKPEYHTITELVYASVVIKPEASYFPQTIRPGLIKEIFVKAGDKVTSGQILARISTPADVQNRLLNSEVNLKEAKENYLGEHNILLNIELELKSVQAQLTADSLQYIRTQKLWSQNIGTQTALEQSELAYRNTQNRKKILQQQKLQTQNSLAHTYTKALHQAQTDRTQLDEFILRAQADGIVYTVNKKEGEYISSQEKLAEIGSRQLFVVEMDIDEEDVTKIEIGDTVIITLNAYSNRIFRALVHTIFPKKDELTQTFRVESHFIEQPPTLYNGLSGEANILVNKKEKALIIPSEYLLRGNKVLTKKGEMQVTTGIKNMRFVEILSGLDTTDVLLNPSDS
jgi:HlyD family secretion protein